MDKESLVSAVKRLLHLSGYADAEDLLARSLVVFDAHDDNEGNDYVDVTITLPRDSSDKQLRRVFQPIRRAFHSVFIGTVNVILDVWIDGESKESPFSSNADEQLLLWVKKLDDTLFKDSYLLNWIATGEEHGHVVKDGEFFVWEHLRFRSPPEVSIA